jgi:hypothetical protein
MEQQTIERLQIKTPEQRFLSVLENDFHKPPGVGEGIGHRRVPAIAVGVMRRGLGWPLERDRWPRCLNWAFGRNELSSTTDERSPSLSVSRSLQGWERIYGIRGIEAALGKRV